MERGYLKDCGLPKIEVGYHHSVTKIYYFVQCSCGDNFPVFSIKPYQLCL